jgi:hypothetical protein
MAVTARYTKDQEGNWKLVPSDYEHSIPCKVCDRGTLLRKAPFRMSVPVVVIGYIILIPSVIGIVSSLVFGALLILMSASAQTSRSAVLFGTLSGGFAMAFAVASFVGGLIGWLLVMRKHTLQCSTCGATIAASPMRRTATFGIGKLALLGILVVICIALYNEKVSPPPNAGQEPIKQASVPEQSPGSSAGAGEHEPVHDSAPERAPERPQVDTSIPSVDLPDRRLTDSAVGKLEPSETTPGILCDGPVRVPQNGQLVFKDLPTERLQFTFDHDLWQASIHREPNGTQTLVMRSLLPGVQTSCYIRWGIVR